MLVFSENVKNLVDISNPKKTHIKNQEKMKKLLILIFATVLSNSVIAQKMVKIYPKTDTLCFGESIYMHIPGQSFNPISFLWSNGSTSSTIEADLSGNYTLTVTGYLGNSSKIVTLTLNREYVVLPKPSVLPQTALWVCKLDTVRLAAEPGYSFYQWNNGVTNQEFEKIFSSIGQGGAVLDTMSVWYTASRSFRNHSCSANSDTIVIRGVRFPEALTPRYCGNNNLSLTDSVKTGLVLTYVWAPAYEVEFTDSSNPSNVIIHTTVPGSRMVPLNMLQVGSTYTVRTRAVINGIPFCWGSTCVITITSASKFGSLYLDELSSTKTFKVYDLGGKFIFERQGTNFNQEWLQDMPQQIYAVITFLDEEIIDRKLFSSKRF